MSILQIFWTLALLLAGLSFAFITAIVTVRGYADLREMFGRLAQQGHTDGNSE